MQQKIQFHELHVKVKKTVISSLFYVFHPSNFLDWNISQGWRNIAMSFWTTNKGEEVKNSDFNQEDITTR